MLMGLGGWIQKIKTNMADALGGYEFDERGKDTLDWSQDEGLDPMERLEKYLGSQLMLHRLYIVRQLSEICIEEGIEKTVEKILPLAMELASDSEPVIKQAFMEQIGAIAVFIYETGGYEEVITLQFIPVVKSLLKDKNTQVRLCAGESLVHICKLLEAETAYVEDVISCILDIAEDHPILDLRSENLCLLQHLLPLCPMEYVEGTVFPSLCKFAKDHFKVRKSVASLLGVCMTLDGFRDQTSLLSLYQELAKDEIWGVKKACVESMMGVVEGSEEEVIRDQLIPLYLKLSVDTSRWVRAAAYGILGPLITKVPLSLTPPLVSCYLDLVAVRGSYIKFSDADIMGDCAYSFPGILVTLGGDRWEQLYPALEKLSKHPQWKVRKPIACSLHEMVRVAEGRQGVLLEMYAVFLSDLDEVKIGALQHMAEFMQYVDGDTRSSMLSLVSDACTGANWRHRREMARQMGRVSGYYDVEVVSSRLIPLYMLLVRDTVAAVRIAAVSSASEIVLALSSNEVHFTSFMNQLLSLVDLYGPYYWRQILVDILIEICLDLEPEVMEVHFLPIIPRLEKDEVANIRMRVGVLLKKLVDAKSPLAEEIMPSLKGLEDDKDKDVQLSLVDSSLLSTLFVIEPNHLLQS